MKEVYKFLKDLSRNNNREWFLANKQRYLDVKARVDELASLLIGLVSEFDPRASRLSASDCTYRIYRDTRFSNDKTPYKTHFGIFINPPLGKKGETLGYYFHLEPEASLVCAGTIWLPPKVLKAVRQSIVDEIDEYRGIVESPDFKACYPELGFDKLKTAPKGFDKDWEFIDYLRPRGFGAQSPVPDSFYDLDGLTERLRPYIRQAWLYNRFINYTVEEELGVES
ncbi:MAG: DUF2461 domain-containing protein [Bacteroides sp.]|nr:DUF2461 domain-containing protein [Bacteroides sp.]